ncbi:MAG TPA: glycosyltransferase [Draconibacterium sp.]|nr:glycosyltransferase [Draconibacterium sp.]
MKLTIVETIKQLTIPEWILLGSFLLVYLVRLYHLLFFTGKIVFKGRKEVIANEQAMEPISVLLTVRNEEENLKRILPQLLTINTVKYEAIAVDDYSLDNTYSVLGSFRQRFNHFKISSLNEETRFSAKLAQNIALKAAQNEWVLILPVDALEVSRDWLGGFAVNTTTHNRKVLIAYSGIETAPGWYNLLCRIENFEQQIRSAGFISNGIPFVYFEENVAFRKKEYFDIGGYGQKTKEPYANLELIINQFITKKNSVIIFNQNTCLRRSVKTDKDDFYNLLQRSYRIERYLPHWKRLALQFEAYSQVLFLPFMLLILILFFNLWPVLSILLGLLVFGKIIMIKIIQNRLNEPKIFITSLVYGVFFSYYKLFYRWFYSRNSRKNKWKIKV